MDHQPKNLYFIKWFNVQYGEGLTVVEDYDAEPALKVIRVLIPGFPE